MSAVQRPATEANEASPPVRRAQAPASPHRAVPQALPLPLAARLLAAPAQRGRSQGPLLQETVLQLQRTVGNRAARRLLALQRQPAPAQQTPPAPAAKPATLKQAGVDVADPVFSGTARLIDTVLQRNRTLAPYIGDRLQAGLRMAEKGKFVQELSDANFDSAYRKTYALPAAETVPTHIRGFYDPAQATVHLRPQADFGTGLHEAMHKLATPTLYAVFLPLAQKVSSTLLEVLKEGLTALFTDTVLQEEGLPDVKDAYRGFKAKAEQLQSALGSDGFALLAKLNFKGAGLVEIGNKLGLSTKQYANLRGGGPKEVFKRMKDQL